MNLEYEQRQRVILNYWFGELKEGEAPSGEYYKMWFSKSNEVDESIKTNFEDDLKYAVEGKLKSWEDSPQGTLALIILLDQFSRNMYRGTERAFAQDSLALGVYLRGVQKGFDKKLHPVERLFFYMPLEHSEDLEMQKKSVEYFTILEKLFTSPPSLASMMTEFRDYAERHYVIIERFGRFPHRNEILERKSTSQEIEFLKQPGSSF
ncbi:MAG: DUF924 domain-containing protein [Candidatus Dadabacteria bacterium]|nr:DUF924 domain-containing protein [Candidatus Dadabacteria bacterium]